MHTVCVCVCMLLRILHSPDPHKLEGKQMDMVLQTNNLKKGFPNWYLFPGDKCGSKKKKQPKKQQRSTFLQRDSMFVLDRRLYTAAQSSASAWTQWHKAFGGTTRCWFVVCRPSCMTNCLTPGRAVHLHAVGAVFGLILTPAMVTSIHTVAELPYSTPHTHFNKSKLIYWPHGLCVRDDGVGSV